jgi:hypothetical protein
MLSWSRRRASHNQVQDDEEWANHPKSSISIYDGEVAAGTADGGALQQRSHTKFPLPQAGGARGGPPPIARGRNAPPKPEAAPMYLAQSHKGTKKGQPDRTSRYLVRMGNLSIAAPLLLCEMTFNLYWAFQVSACLERFE